MQRRPLLPDSAWQVLQAGGRCADAPATKTMAQRGSHSLNGAAVVRWGSALVQGMLAVAGHLQPHRRNDAMRREESLRLAMSLQSLSSPLLNSLQRSASTLWGSSVLVLACLQRRLRIGKTMLKVGPFCRQSMSVASWSGFRMPTTVSRSVRLLVTDQQEEERIPALQVEGAYCYVMAGLFGGWKLRRNTRKGSYYL